MSGLGSFNGERAPPDVEDMLVLLNIIVRRVDEDNGSTSFRLTRAKRDGKRVWSIALRGAEWTNAEVWKTLISKLVEATSDVTK